MKPELSQADINSFAIFSIKTGSQFTLGDTYASLIWPKNNTEEKPTEKEFNDAVTAWKTDYDAQEYARNRANEYPSIQDVTVALAEKEEGDSTMWDEITAKRAAVKAKYSKP